MCRACFGTEVSLIQNVLGLKCSVTGHTACKQPSAAIPKVSVGELAFA